MPISDLDNLVNADPSVITGEDKAHGAAVDSDKNLHVEVHGNDQSGNDKTLRFADEGSAHVGYNAIVDTNNSVSSIVLPAYLGTEFKDSIVPGSALPAVPADTWISSSWTSVKDFAAFGVDALSSALGRGFAIWSNDGGTTVSRYETTLFAGAGAFSDPPQGATHLKIAFQNLSNTTNTFKLNTILRYQAQGQFMAPVNAPLDASFPATLTKSVSTGQRPDETFDNIRIQGVDPNNSTVTPLGANETYRGDWFKWKDSFSKFAVSVRADTSGIFWIDFSDKDAPVNGDDTGVDGTVVYAYDPALHGLFREHVPVQSKWVRVRYSNGSVAQTEFSVNSVVLVNDPGLVALQLRIIPNKSQLAGIVKNIPAIPTADGNTYQDLPVSSMGNPKQSVEEIHDDILIEPLNSAQASQTLVGTSPVQLDSSPLANRRVANVSNDGPLRIAVGHSPSMTFDSGSIRLNPGSTRTFGIDASVPLYAICENLGGVQTTSNRSPSSASGTATNPNNAISSNNSYANITANGQTVNATGFTAGTTNEIAQIRLGMEINRPSGITNTAAFQDSRTGSADGAVSVSTTSTVIAAANNLYLAAVSRRNNVANTVTSVTGLGLTWTQIVSQPSDDGLRSIDLWYAIGNPTGNSVVTATFSAAPIHSHISVTRYSNVNPTTPIADFDVGQANNASPTTPALSGVDKGIAYMAVAGANRTMTAGSGYTLDSSELTNDGGNSDSLSVEHKALIATGPETPTGTLSGNAHWAAISVILNPSEAANPIVNLSYTLSAVPGTTSSNITPTSDTDATFFVNITGDRSWVFGDIANVNVIATGQTIGLVQANIDHLFIELTDTTGNVSRVSLWQGAKAVT